MSRLQQFIEWCAKADRYPDVLWACGTDITRNERGFYTYDTSNVWTDK